MYQQENELREVGESFLNVDCTDFLFTSYDKYKKPSWTPGSSFGYIAAAYVVTGMLDGVAVFAGLQVSRYELFKSVSTAAVFLFFKAFYFIWPAVLFHFENLIMVSQNLTEHVIIFLLQIKMYDH